eukprot:tig00000989_g6114.t1
MGIEEASIGQEARKHLLLVVHGVGSQAEGKAMGSPISVCASRLQSTIDRAAGRYGCAPEEVSVRFIEWHEQIHNLYDDGMWGGTLTTGVKTVRNALNDKLADCFMFMSAHFGGLILRTVVRLLNEAYAAFLAEARAAEPGAPRPLVSVFAHSLGSLIMFDVLSGRSVIDRRDGPMAVPPLDFEVDTLFLVGSPIGAYLSLNGSPLGYAKVPHLCRRMYNLFHPHDPVAYRFEPWHDRAYKDVPPVLVEHHEGDLRVHYRIRALSEDLRIRIQLMRKGFHESLEEGKRKMESWLKTPRGGPEGAPGRRMASERPGRAAQRQQRRRRAASADPASLRSPPAGAPRTGRAGGWRAARGRGLASDAGAESDTEGEAPAPAPAPAMPVPVPMPVPVMALQRKGRVASLRIGAAAMRRSRSAVDIEAPLALRDAPLLAGARQGRERRLDPRAGAAHAAGRGRGRHHGRRRRRRAWSLDAALRDRRLLQAASAVDQELMRGAPLRDSIKSAKSGGPGPGSGADRAEAGCGGTGSPRYDFVLQETPLQNINEFFGLMQSHFSYWEDPDVANFILQRLFSGGGALSDGPATARLLQAPPGEVASSGASASASTHESDTGTDSDGREAAASLRSKLTALEKQDADWAARMRAFLRDLFPTLFDE